MLTIILCRPEVFPKCCRKRGPLKPSWAPLCSSVFGFRLQTDFLTIETFYPCISCAGGCAQSEEEEAGLSRGSGVCKWFNVRMGFGFLSMSSRDGAPVEPPVDVFAHQVSLCCCLWLKDKSFIKDTCFNQPCCSAEVCRRSLFLVGCCLVSMLGNPGK